MSKAMFAAGAVMLLVGTFLAGVSTGSAAEAASATTVTIKYVAVAGRGVPSPCGQVTGKGAAKVVDLSMAAFEDLVKCQATFRVLS